MKLFGWFYPEVYPDQELHAIMSAIENRLTPMQGGLCLASCVALILGLTIGLTFSKTAMLVVTSLDYLSSLLFLAQGSSRFLKRKYAYSRKEKIRDVLVAIPLSPFIFNPKLGLLAALLGAIKLIKFREVATYIRFKRENLELKRHHTLLLGALAFALSIHTIACCWISINPTTDTDLTTIYVKAIYFIVTTMATVGYGDITPSTNMGRLFAMLIMIIGVGGYSLLVAQISKTLLEHDKRKTQTQYRLAVLESFLRHYEIPVALQKSVYGFYNHLLSHQMNDVEEEILNTLPTALQSELKIYMNVKPLAHVSLFKNCEASCIIEASGYLEHVYFSPGETIVAKGDTGAEMFVVGHGSVTVIKNEAVVAILHDGDCFGELSLIFDGVRQATIKAKSYCDLFKLSRENFQKLVRTHPELKKNIDALVANRQE